MAKIIEVNVPDIGDATDVDVIEILVSVGDAINKGDSLVTLESDKASMDVPSSEAGIVKAISIKVGDKVSEGSLVLTLESESKKEVLQETKKEIKEEPPVKQPSQDASPKAQVTQSDQEVTIPDIGDASNVDVIEVLVKVGSEVKKDDSLLTLEGDKATMDIPSPFSGTVKKVLLKVGDKVSEGTPLLVMSANDLVTEKEDAVEKKETKPEPSAPSKKSNKEPVKRPSVSTSSNASHTVYASPSIRRLAREFGVDLSLVEGSGRKSRVVIEDVKNFVKSRLASSGGGYNIPKSKEIDFSKYGEVKHQPLNKIKRLTAQNMHRAWVTVPHVTQFDEADITELESFRQAEKEKAIKEGYKLTPLAFIVKALVSALKKFPAFNSSLSQNGETLILKSYCNIGIAVDTPNGLVVPVIKDADKMSIGEIARAMGELSQKARNKSLTPADMSGGCFTISSLGGISGTAFTPIVNAPEVAILGVSKSKWQPVLKGEDFVPRLILPYSLSYDHRVIDGAEGARFTQYLTHVLSDIRTLLL
jgi:pyruvate dehydrogenase E2 component (dihydrolipoamide acetyltransferase)